MNNRGPFLYGDSRGRDHSGAAVVAVLSVIALIVVLGLAAFNAFHVRHMTCTVNEKDRTTKVTSDSNGNVTSSSDARLYTDQCGVLHVSDSLLSWHFNSADTYASIKEGRTYEITTRGYRIPFFSMFPNVVDATEVTR